MSINPNIPSGLNGTDFRTDVNNNLAAIINEFTTDENNISAIASKDFGAIGDGNSHPANTLYSTLAALQAKYPFATSLNQELDYLGWQAALNAGGQVISTPNHYIMCNSNSDSQSPLTVISGKSWVDGYGAKLDFSAMTAQSSSEHFITNYNFANSLNWTNASIYTSNQILNAVFGSGAAIVTDSSSYPAQSSFCQFGQQVILQPGIYRATCTFTATEGASFSAGNPNPPWCNISFFATSPGQGSNFTGKSAVGTGLIGVLQGPVTQTIHFDFIVTEETTAYYTFTGGGYANWSISDMDIVPFLYNTSILLTRDGASESYPIMMPFGGVEIVGPSISTGVTGILYKSFTDIDGNIMSLKDISITNFNTGFEAQDGAYLGLFENVNIYGNGTNFKFNSGNTNAGENFRFIGGGLFNSAVGIDNIGGAEISLFGTALDYCTQGIVNNTGRIELHGCHVELNLPATAGKPLFQCTGYGQITFFGGMFVSGSGTGAISTVPEPPVQLVDAFSSMVFNDTEIYNLGSASGFACSGAGTLKINGLRNQGNPSIGPIMLSQALSMDILGGAGTFETQSSDFKGQDPLGIFISGGIYTDDSIITNRWTTPSLTAQISSDYAHSGTQSLKIAKISGSGSNSRQIALLIPVREGHHVKGQIFFLFPNNVGTGTGYLYYRQFFAQVAGYDLFNRPIFNAINYFKGENDIQVPLAGSSSWIQRNIDSTYDGTNSSSLTANNGEMPPIWATHYVILLDLQSLPNLSFYIDDFTANLL